jgi:hypothetical protein
MNGMVTQAYHTMLHVSILERVLLVFSVSPNQFLTVTAARFKPTEEIQTIDPPTLQFAFWLRVNTGGSH